MIKVIFFDLDGTLYKSNEIRQAFSEAAYHTLARFKNIPLEKAQAIIEDRRTELGKKQGSPVPYTLTLVSCGIPIELWHKENIAFFDPRDYLSKDKKLKQNMLMLKEQYRLAILTNNNDIQTERIIEALDILNLFDKVFTYNSFNLLKPDLNFFKKAAHEMGVKPQECCMIGDRYDVDLNPAKELGMQIYEVKGPEDINNLVETSSTHHFLSTL